jgi:threonyl-tRNA synthetase
VVGRREAEAGTVAVRLRNGEQLPPATIRAFGELIGAVITSRSPELLPPAFG